jgi:hypothetical protein
VDVVLGEDEPAAVQDVELPRPALRDRRVEPLLRQLGRETRGPAVVAASDGAIEDLDTHRPEMLQTRWTPGKSRSGAMMSNVRTRQRENRSRNTAKQGCTHAARRGHTLDKSRGSRRMRIKLSDADQLQRLLAFLAFDANVVVSQIARDEVEVSFLGSLNTSAQMMQSELRLKLWLVAHPDVIAVMQE